MNLKTKLMWAGILGLITSLWVGCGDGDSSKKEEPPEVAYVPASLFVDKAPEGAKKISELKASAKEGDEVVIKAIVGGSNKVFLEKKAVMTVMDASVFNKCNSSDDHCKTPWDYCCADSKLKVAERATVKILDEKGKVLDTNISNIDVFSTKASSYPTTLIIKGKVGPRASNEVLTIHATAIHPVKK